MVVIKYDLNAHRTAVPIDHPDGSVTRVKLEYPTVDVNLGYLMAIGKATYLRTSVPWSGHGTVDSFADKAIEGYIFDAYYASVTIHLIRVIDGGDAYMTGVYSGFSTQDLRLEMAKSGSITVLGYESVDLPGGRTYYVKASCSGSTFKVYREDMSVAKFSVSDTSIAAGRWGRGSAGAKGSAFGDGWLRAPSSPLPSAVSIFEVGVEGSGRSDDPYRPLMSRNLVPISQLSGLPVFLYREAKKYEVLRARGFTDEEIEAVFGPIKYKVDLDAVTLGAFEFSPDKSPTAIVTVVGDNPYSLGAVERQRGVAKRWWSPPRGYNEAVELYRQISRDFPHWLAGKDNFAYQVLGWEELEWLQNVDFYYGELVEHRTHYSQLKQVSDDEIRSRLNELIGKLSSMGVLGNERNSHIAKAKEVLRRGW